MSETWMDEKGWVKGRLLRRYVWEGQWARRNRKGRAGRMIIAIRRGIKIERKNEGHDKEALMVRKVWVRRNCWRIIEVYINNDIEKKLEDLKEWRQEDRK